MYVLSWTSRIGGVRIIRSEKKGLRRRKIWKDIVVGGSYAFFAVRMFVLLCAARYVTDDLEVLEANEQ